MGRYLIQVSYTAEGARGLLKEGALRRRKVVEEIVEGMGGRVVSFDFAFGENDVYVITETDGEGHVDVAAVSLAVAASGAARLETVVLLSAEEMDAATKRSVAYRPPGA